VESAPIAEEIGLKLGVVTELMAEARSYGHVFYFNDVGGRPLDSPVHSLAVGPDRAGYRFFETADQL
jgi:hypothetical protein